MSQESAVKSCQKEVRWSTDWSRRIRACGRPAKYERDGKHFCGIHNPARHEAARKLQDERWEEARAKRRMSEAAEDLYAALHAIVVDEGDGIDLMTNARAALLKAHPAEDSL